MTLLSVEVNLTFAHSHPESRNTLSAIRCIVKLLNWAKTSRARLIEAINQSTPSDSVKAHIKEMFSLVVVRRMHQNLQRKAHSILDFLLTEYMHSIAKNNRI